MRVDCTAERMLCVLSSSGLTFLFKRSRDFRASESNKQISCFAMLL